MGRKIRIQKADAIYFVSNKCFQDQFLFKPDAEVNAIILSALAYAAQKYKIEIFAFVFMSNHFHMLVRSRLLLLHLFMRDFQSEVARRLNAHWHRKGSFFHDRYSSIEILDDAMLVEKLQYTLCNPCESRLVRHPKRWPGLSSWGIHETGKPLVGKRVDRDKYWRLRRKHKEMSPKEAERRATIEYPLEMARLPQWEDLDDASYHAKVCAVVEERALELAEQPGAPFLGPQKVVRQPHTARPRRVVRSPRPACLTADLELRAAFIDDERRITGLYRAAVGRVRAGKADAEFPPGTIPPGHLQCVGAAGSKVAAAVVI